MHEMSPRGEVKAEEAGALFEPLSNPALQPRYSRVTALAQGSRGRARAVGQVGWTLYAKGLP